MPNTTTWNQRVIDTRCELAVAMSKIEMSAPDRAKIDRLIADFGDYAYELGAARVRQDLVPNKDVGNITFERVQR